MTKIEGSHSNLKIYGGVATQQQVLSSKEQTHYLGD
jgi:hypothetical protein